jgi:kynurenine formamidase
MNLQTKIVLIAVLLAGCESAGPRAKSGSGAGSSIVGPLIGDDSAARTSNSAAARRFSGRIVDLTHPFDSQTIYWPTETGFEFKPGNNGRTSKGYYYAANRFAAPEHGGTHLDAPIHFAEGKPTAEQVDVARLIGEAAVVDVSAACKKDRDYLISVADLQAWEERTGRQLVDVIVLLRTGWSSRWPDRLKYLGTERRGPEAIAELRFPGLAPEAARWLVEQRGIKAIGIDTASIDYGKSTHFESHVILCGRSVPVLENVANLEQLPERGATIVALPMKIAGGSGGPLRIVGIVGD